jgi:hypothetical protein
MADSVKHTWGLYYKTFRIHNLRKIDIFYSKPVPFTGLDKHTSFNKYTSLLRSPYITNP